MVYDCIILEKKGLDRGEVGLNQDDRERIIEILLSQERVLGLLYDKTFPPRQESDKMDNNYQHQKQQQLEDLFQNEDEEEIEDDDKIEDLFSQQNNQLILDDYQNQIKQNS